MTTRTAKRTRIDEDWQPTADGRAYAESHGVLMPDQVEAYVDYHLMHGTLMADWSAAWRTWCRNSAKFGGATGRSTAPLLSIVRTADPNDPWGCRRWAASLPDAKLDTMADGTRVPCLGGYDAAGVAFDVCKAVGLAVDWTGSLDLIGEWLRAGIEPDTILAAVTTISRHPDKAGAWRWYSTRVHEMHQKRRAA